MFAPTEYLTHQKPCFLFLEVLKRWSFEKKLQKLGWNMIFLVLLGKMIFLFPENMILFFWQKMKDDLSRKKYMEILYFLQIFWKDSLFKTIAQEYDISCIIWKDGILSPKTWYFFFGRKMKDDLSQEIHDIFCTYV